jgi:hypothetical protein
VHVHECKEAAGLPRVNLTGGRISNAEFTGLSVSCCRPGSRRIDAILFTGLLAAWRKAS